MTDHSLLILSFLAGNIISGAIALLLHRRAVSGLNLSSSSNANRLRELEGQLSRQAEKFSDQLSRKAREHMDELERVGRERRQLEEGHAAEITARAREAEDRGYEAGKRQAELRADEKAKAFSVIVRPF